MRVLVVEDEPLVAFDLQMCIEEELGARVTIVTSVDAADCALQQPFDFVLLDVSVVGGTTFVLARSLQASGTPFVFASASNRVDIPEDLRSAVFLPKPCCARAIRDAIIRAVQPDRAASGS